MQHSIGIHWIKLEIERQVCKATLYINYKNIDWQLPTFIKKNYENITFILTLSEQTYVQLKYTVARRNYFDVEPRNSVYGTKP